jgi:uncharacterized membrane protein
MAHGPKQTSGCGGVDAVVDAITAPVVTMARRTRSRDFFMALTQLYGVKKKMQARSQILRTFFQNVALSTGLGLSLFLHRIRGVENQFCGELSGCAAVANSDLAQRSPVALPVLGIAWFTALLVMSILGYRKVLQAASWAGLAVSTGFTAYALFVVRAACPYCLGVFTVSAVLPFAIPHSERVRQESTGILTVGLTCVAIAVAWISTLRPPAQPRINLTPSEVKTLTLFPSVGDQPRPTRGVIVDFDCPHCRSVLRQLPMNTGRVAIVAVTRSERSRELHVLHHAAIRQGLQERFLATLPSPSLLGEWYAVRSNELKPTSADRAESRRVAAQAKKVVDRFGVRAYPTWLEFPSANRP